MAKKKSTSDDPQAFMPGDIVKRHHEAISYIIHKLDYLQKRLDEVETVKGEYGKAIAIQEFLESQHPKII
jgi:non-homologous end joining protein Ku